MSCLSCATRRRHARAPSCLCHVGLRALQSESVSIDPLKLDMLISASATRHPPLTSHAHGGEFNVFYAFEATISTSTSPLTEDALTSPRTLLTAPSPLTEDAVAVPHVAHLHVAADLGDGLRFIAHRAGTFT